jgi:hypothetical protein
MFVLLAASCRNVSGLVNGAGRVLDGSAFAEKTIKTYKSTDKSIMFQLFFTKDGEQQSVFVLNELPFLRFYGTALEETGLFSITRMHFLFSGIGGWLEGDIGASGSGVVVEIDDPSAGQSAEFSLQCPVNLLKITRGGIKRHSDRLYGNRALTELRNREDRILRVTEWMKERDPPAQLATQRDFEDYWRPVLLPETVNKKLRPSRYVEICAAQNGDDAYAYGEDIKWNTAYTRELFPAHLCPLRDSGSLLRDWEEAASWFYVVYYWDVIAKDLYEKHYLYI